MDKLPQLSSLDEEFVEDVFEYDASRHIDYVIGFKNFMAVFVREQGLPKLMIRNYNDKSSFYAQMPDAAYELEMSSNEEFDTPFVRIYYSSLVTPDSWYVDSPIYL